MSIWQWAGLGIVLVMGIIDLLWKKHIERKYRK